MPLLGVGTAVPVQATTGQKQGPSARHGSSPCSVPLQQHVLAEVKGLTPKSGCYRLAPVAPALPRLVPGCTMTLKRLLFAIRVGGGLFGGEEGKDGGKIILIFLFSQLLPIVLFSCAFRFHPEKGSFKLSARFLERQ